MTRYLLCRPQGGLNDMLVQIEKCCRYAELSGRTVIVDTNYEHSVYFKDNFSNYFKSKQRKLILNIDEHREELEDMKVFPEFLQGRLHDYKVTTNKISNKLYENESGEYITFKQDINIPHQLVVHHMYGGGSESFFALMRLSLSDSVVNELFKRLKIIGPMYNAVHVRNTDYETSYEKHIGKIKELFKKRIFLATDNTHVLSNFKNSFEDDRIYSFSKISGEVGKPMHTAKLSSNDAYNRNQDAILDLVMLSLANKLYFLKLENSSNGGFSGFSLLASKLWESKIVLKNLIGNPNLRFGLE